jgi:hypothetical protein
VSYCPLANRRNRRSASYASRYAIAGTDLGAYSSVLTLRSELRISAANCSRATREQHSPPQPATAATREEHLALSATSSHRATREELAFSISHRGRANYKCRAEDRISALCSSLMK